MATHISLKLANRSPKKQLKKLPASVDVPHDAIIEDLQKAVARQAGVKDFNQVGLFYPSTKKRIGDRKALVREQEDVMSRGEVLVQDLGPQVSWRTVYLVEYLGPLLFHPFFVGVRPLLARSWVFYGYAGADKTPLTVVQKMCLAMFVSHFAKRELETAFLHRFAANTLPAWNIIRNSFFYWTMAGLAAGYLIYTPRAWAARAALGPLDYLGVALFLAGEAGNYAVHAHLATLRKPGGTEKGIPSCIGSGLVTCPNYMFEVIAWLGIILVSREPAVVYFILVGIKYMRDWSKGKEKSLRELFGDKYKAKKYTMLPGLI